MVERRRSNSFFGSSAEIREPELDMRRKPPRRTRRVASLLAAWKWLAPSYAPMGSPTRSVDREHAEAFPTWQ